MTINRFIRCTEVSKGLINSDLNINPLFYDQAYSF